MQKDRSDLCMLKENKQSVRKAQFIHLLGFIIKYPSSLIFHVDARLVKQYLLFSFLLWVKDVKGSFKIAGVCTKKTLLTTMCHEVSCSVSACFQILCIRVALRLCAFAFACSPALLCLPSYLVVWCYFDRAAGGRWNNLDHMRFINIRLVHWCSKKKKCVYEGAQLCVTACLIMRMV